MNDRPIERCFACDDPTGHAGKGEDSRYDVLGMGPYCDDCWAEQRQAFVDDDGEAAKLHDEHEEVHSFLDSINATNPSVRERLFDRVAALVGRHSLAMQRAEIADSKVALAERRFEAENEVRLRYQNIVYAACNALDVALARHVSGGSGTTVDEVVSSIGQVVAGRDAASRRESETATLLDAARGDAADYLRLLDEAQEAQRKLELKLEAAGLSLQDVRGKIEVMCPEHTVFVKAEAASYWPPCPNSRRTTFIASVLPGYDGAACQQFEASALKDLLERVRIGIAAKTDEPLVVAAEGERA